MNHILTTIREKYKSNFIRNWRCEIEESLTCIGYDEFKDEFKLEPYLIKLKFGQRLILSKFRCRSNYLPISDFEQFNNPYFVPECPFCQCDYADEEHYLLQCPKFDDQRVELMNYFPNIDAHPCQIKVILCSEDAVVLLELAKFCRIFMDALKTHKNNIVDAESNSSTTIAII